VWKTYAAGAGVVAKTFPLTTGVISARLVANGTVVDQVSTNEAVVTSRPVQDLGYRFANSLRQ
jgi:hypothetical protein